MSDRSAHATALADRGASDLAVGLVLALLWIVLAAGWTAVAYVVGDSRVAVAAVITAELGVLAFALFKIARGIVRLARARGRG